jgi:hypothetical protein
LELAPRSSCATGDVRRRADGFGSLSRKAQGVTANEVERPTFMKVDSAMRCARRVWRKLPRLKTVVPVGEVASANSRPSTREPMTNDDATLRRKRGAEVHLGRIDR